MLLILKGSVRVLKQGYDQSNPKVIGRRGPGDFLGEIALVEESPRFATVVAETACEVLEFSRKNFEKVIGEQPALATRVLRSLSRKLRESDSDRIAELEESNRLLSKTNDELIRLNSFLDCIIDQSPSGVVLTTRTGDIFQMNKATAMMFDIDNPDGDRQIDSLFSDFRLAAIRDFSGNIWTGEVKGLRKGEEFPIYLSITSLSGQSDGILHLMICQDISELQVLNETIVDIEKYESAKETAIELAHDMKNYLSVLLGHTELVLSRLTPQQQEKSKNSIQAIGVASDEVIQFVENMMIFRDDNSELRPVDLSTIIRLLIRFCQSQPRFRDIRFTLEKEEDFPQSLQLKEDQIRRVVINLLINAGEALSQCAEITDKQVTVRLQTRPQEKIAVVEVTDNGPGIAEEHLTKLFRECFTTKEKGHGIGLISAARILRGHGGKIAVDSKLGHGATFKIKLPVKKD